jgi:ATP-dependent exoDNAse (exonuclease V) beta subunit
MNFQLKETLNKINESTGTYKLQKEIYKACPYSVSKIVETLHKPFDQQTSAQKVFEKYFDDETSKYYHMSVDEIISSWEEKGRFGRENGKCLDKYIGMLIDKHESDDILEKYISSLNPVAANKCREYSVFYQNNIKDKLEFVGRELMLHFPELKVNGRLDALFLKDDKLILIDWKNNDKLSIENPYEKCRGPLYLYDASDLNLYTVQVYIYAYILRKVYKLDNINIIPLIIRIGEHDYNIYSPIIPYSDKLVEDTISFAAQEINKQIEKDKENVNILEKIS